MNIRIIDEFNDEGHLLYAADYTGAYSRGRTRQEALSKLRGELLSYLAWRGASESEISEASNAGFMFVQEKRSSLHIEDADSDVIFDDETLPLTAEEYERLKTLALKSARDFLKLYGSIPDKDGTVLKRRTTFYGGVPVTAREMYEHTKSVISYYFGEIGVSADNDGDILSDRAKGFSALEATPDFLENRVFDGSYDEKWSLRKVLRRFVWHDRIHARAMYRMAVRLCGGDAVADPFRFAAPREVVAAVIREGERMLVCRRPAYKAHGLKWEFPGGKVEPGESGEEALVRECREELGVTLKVGSRLAETTYYYPDISVHITFYCAEIINGTPKRLEHDALAWVTPEEAAALEFCPADRGVADRGVADRGVADRGVADRGIDDRGALKPLNEGRSDDRG